MNTKIEIRMPAGMPGKYHRGAPCYWRDEIRDLKPAVEHYLRFRTREDPVPLTQDEIDVVAWYCRYWVNAPIWTGGALGNNKMEADLVELRHRARHLASVEAIARWLEEALESGIDPL